MNGPGFIHLRVHSGYSLLEGALPIARLIDLVKADEQPAIAITDTSNLFGALEFSEKAWGAGIQPIPGVQLAVDFGDGGIKRGRATEHLSDVVLLAADAEGYANLMDVVSRAYLDTDPSMRAHVPLSRILEKSAGVILLTGGVGGPVGQAICAGEEARARSRLEALAAVFGDRLYVEIQRHGMPEEIASEPATLALAYDLGLPLVATNEPFFASRDDYEAHDALIAIAEGRVIAEDDRRRLTPALPCKAVEAGADPAAIRRRVGGSGCRFHGRGRGIATPVARGPGGASCGARAGAGRCGGGLLEPARLRAWRHRGDALSRLLPDRCRLHQMGQGAGHSGGAGAWLGCGLARCLVVDDYRP